MNDALFWHRLQFAFTIVYLDLFPQRTMGLAFTMGFALRIEAQHGTSSRPSSSLCSV